MVRVQKSVGFKLHFLDYFGRFLDQKRQIIFWIIVGLKVSKKGLLDKNVISGQFWIFSVVFWIGKLPAILNFIQWV